MTRPLDLDELRRVIAEAPHSGTAAVVTRGFLEQVEREIVAGQVAKAQLNRLACMAEVVAGLANGEPA